MHIGPYGSLLLGSYALLLKGIIEVCSLRSYLRPASLIPLQPATRAMSHNKKDNHSSARLKSSPGSVEALIGKSAKHFVVGSVCLVVWLSDSILPTYYVAGGVANSILSKVLKTIIRQPRPEGSPKGGHGMPSSHSQSILYFASVLWWKASEIVLSSTSSTMHSNAAIIGSIVVLLYSYYACVYRISTGRHTIEQTLVGAIVGMITGTCAYYIETTELRYLVPQSLMNYTPVWFRYFIIVSAAVILYRKELLSRLFKRK